ncbi:hypothetical protein M569_16045 [Genlisea aurea]|uniref:Histidine-containing phosphotransfer protein n=1 Tax=Genlisea aurea TaxID=192259 RepID=S8D7R7_9LAMI|nr:hypothetical protein M569_16045 [Genlisea aurea]
MDDFVGQLKRQYVDFSTCLFREGFLDDQFLQLQKLQDETNPDFAFQVISIFFDESEKLFDNLSIALQQPVVDFKRVDSHVHQFKGSSSSIGAQRVKNLCDPFRKLCEDKNVEGCLQQMKHEYYLVKNKLETLSRMEQQIREASAPPPSSSRLL